MHVGLYPVKEPKPCDVEYLPLIINISIESFHLTIAKEALCIQALCLVFLCNELIRLLLYNNTHQYNIKIQTDGKLHSNPLEFFIRTISNISRKELWENLFWREKKKCRKTIPKNEESRTFSYNARSA